MDITVYLPDELGQWAKDAGLPFSQMLRAEVQAERDRRQAAATLQKAAEVHELDVEDAQTGHSYTARFHGTPLHELEGNAQAFLSEDGDVWVYIESSGNLEELTEGVMSVDEQLQLILCDGEYIEAMHAL